MSFVRYILFGLITFLFLSIGRRWSGSSIKEGFGSSQSGRISHGGRGYERLLERHGYERQYLIDQDRISAIMFLQSFTTLQFKTSDVFGTASNRSNPQSLPTKRLSMKQLVVEAKANTRTDNAKIRNRRTQKKFNGTATKPRLSVFCSDKQLYATLVDDVNKKCLFYGSTLQKSIRGDPPCTKIEAAERVGDELVKTCIDLEINEISAYDRNGFSRGERMAAFEVAISRHGFLPG